ncbi:ABC transporter permease [Ruminococcus sp. 5_1_39BFAA]|uniref:ABC transporter permease n=1 Tax=Ruminococcus sp. 5_1_39BFAA TaxID=457412 RepID=UPI00356AF916
MKKNFLIARSNIRKAKGQTAAIIVLILLAAMMMNLWLMLSMDYKRNFERYHDRLNAEHVTLALGSRDAGLRSFISEILGKDARTEEYCMGDALFMVGSFAYNGGEVNAEFIIQEKQAALNRSVGRIEIVEDSDFTSGIYLPMLYSADSNLTVGQTIELTIGSHVEKYTVCGFLNSVMTGSHNCSMTTLMFTEDKFKELEEKGYAPKSTLVSVRIHDEEESEDFETDLSNEVSSQYPGVRILSNSYTLVASSRYISQMICSGIVSAMAFFVTLIALVVIASNVINYIQENMKNLGALKAAGYTSKQLICVLLLQFTGVALLTSTAGIALSYCLFPGINRMMISQTGIPYRMRFLPMPFLITFVLVEGTIAFTVWLSARRIKKIAPIVALRQGVQTHNFKRNHVPLDRTKVSLNLALAFKTTLSGVKQNVTVCVTMLVLSLIVVFSGLMTENVIVDMGPFVDLIVGETADSCINVNVESEDHFLQVMDKDERVEKAYLYNSIEVLHVDGVALTATLTEDFGKVNNQKVVFEGRFPKFDNEVAIAAKYAKEYGLKIGDEITMAAEGNEKDYIISGFTQISNNLGKDCLLTRSGYERMGSLRNVSYYINLAEGTDVDAFNEEISRQLGNSVNVTINIESVMNGTATVYVSLMTIIVIAILVLSGIIITFVLYLLVRIMLNNKKRDYGILKALGFTTRQLVLQTAVSFMPAVILSTAVGIVVNAFLINPLVGLFLNGIGIVKCTFKIPVGFITAAGIGLVLFAFGIACLLSLKIRKITPRALLAGE